MKQCCQTSLQNSYDVVTMLQYIPFNFLCRLFFVSSSLFFPSQFPFRIFHIHFILRLIDSVFFPVMIVLFSLSSSFFLIALHLTLFFFFVFRLYFIFLSSFFLLSNSFFYFHFHFHFSYIPEYSSRRDMLFLEIET